MILKPLNQKLARQNQIHIVQMKLIVSAVFNVVTNNSIADILVLCWTVPSFTEECEADPGNLLSLDICKQIVYFATHLRSD